MTIIQKAVIMNQSVNKLDEAFKNKANGIHISPKNSSWERIEQKLSYSLWARFMSLKLVKIAAVLLPLIILFSIANYYMGPSASTEIVNLTHTTEDEYYSDYLSFLRSDRYNNLELAYKAHE
jgi:hypothetical protein